MSIPDNTATQTEQKSEATEELTDLQKAEKRYRDTQSAYTKGQQALKAKEAENEALKELVTQTISVNLTPEQKEELEDLKFSDPEAWRNKVNSYESEARANIQEKLAAVTAEAGQTAGAQFELERRQQVLKEFNESAKIPITDELIANDVPPRITKKLENGEITFEDFLAEVDTYVNKGKTVSNEETMGQPNLSKLSGGLTPNDEKAGDSLSESYSKDVY